MFGGEASFSQSEVEGMMDAMANYNTLGTDEITSVRNDIATGLGISATDRDAL